MFRLFKKDEEDYKKKYNTLLVKYESLANSRICELEKERDILIKNIEYKNKIDELKEEVKRYKIRCSRLKGGDKNDKGKIKR